MERGNVTIEESPRKLEIDALQRFSTLAKHLRCEGAMRAQDNRTIE
jgi:hypothetical protein